MGRKAGKYGIGGQVVRAYIPQILAEAWEKCSDNFKMQIIHDAGVALGKDPSNYRPEEKKGPGRPSTKTEGQKEQKEQYEINTLRTQRTQAKDPHMPRSNPALEAKYGHILDEQDTKIKQVLEERQNEKQNQKKTEVDQKQYDYSHWIQGEPYSKEEVNMHIEEIGEVLKQKGRDKDFILQMAIVTREKMKEKFSHLYDEYEEENKPLNTWANEI